MIILCNMYRIYQELTFVTCVSMPIFENIAWGGGTGGGVGGGSRKKHQHLQYYVYDPHIQYSTWSDLLKVALHFKTQA